MKTDGDKLKLLGRAGGKRAVTALQPPGQPRLLESSGQGTAWLILEWKAPDEGGKPDVYKVQRRLQDDSIWQDVTTATITKAILFEQPRGVKLQYRIVAANKTGEGSPSNTAMVVL